MYDTIHYIIQNNINFKTLELFGQQSDEFNINVFIKYYIYRNNYVISSSEEDDCEFTKHIKPYKSQKKDKIKPK